MNVLNNLSIRKSMQSAKCKQILLSFYLCNFIIRILIYHIWQSIMSHFLVQEASPCPYVFGYSSTKSALKKWGRRQSHGKVGMSTEQNERVPSLFFGGNNHILFCWLRTYQKISTNKFAAAGVLV